MSQYKFNDDTLLHSIGFNPFRLENILKTGIYAKEEADKKKISFARNYMGYNGEDRISLTKPLYSDSNDKDSCYNKYVLRGISLIIEGQDYISDFQDYYFNHADEVYVKETVPLEKIKGLLIPEKYADEDIRNLPVITLKATSYENIKDSAETLINYLKSYNHEVNKDEYNTILYYLMTTINAYTQSKDEELLEDFEDARCDLDEFLSNEVALCFQKKLNKEKVTVSDLVSFINDKTLKLPIYEISNKGKKYHV